MKKQLFLLSAVIFFVHGFSQNGDLVNGDAGVSKDSYNSALENINIPLHIINIDGIEIPIFLSYNSNGMKVSDIPSSVGFGWELYAGGEIDKTINHLVDENEKGWLFAEGEDQYFSSCDIDTQSNYLLKDLFRNVDSEPDFFNVNISNGDYLNYIYPRRNTDNPVILSQNGNFYGNNIKTDVDLMKQYDFSDNDKFYENEEDADIKITNKKGVTYFFRKGLSRIIPYDVKRNQRNRIDSTEVKNYYLHKVSSSFTNSEIKFDYTNNKVNKYIRFTRATRVQTNSETHTPPHYSDNIYTRGYYDDISIEDASRKEIRRITTPKEIVEFIYHNKTYHPGSVEIPSGSGSFQYENYVKPQSIKLLREIKIYDHRNNYISGYSFIYTTAGQDPNHHEGNLKIKQILKHGLNQSETYIFREFSYFNTFNAHFSSITNSGFYPATTSAQDVLGYPNGEFSNGQGNNLILQAQANIRMPDVNELKKGMLKSIRNTYGGITEYNYVENSYRQMYYGGLLINSIIKYDTNGTVISKINYDYDEPEGFGLPVYAEPVQFSPYETTYGIYEEGFFDYQVPMYDVWQTFFTQKGKRSICQDLSYIYYYNISNLPYSLDKNTPALDDYFRETGSSMFQDLPKIEYGAFYKRIKETKINTDSNEAEKGYIISYYSPTFKGNLLDKKLTRIEYYNKSNVKIKEKLFNYDIINRGSVNAFKFIAHNSQFYNTDNLPYTSTALRVDNYNIYRVEDVLRSTEVNKFDNTGFFLSNYTSNFQYLNDGAQAYADYTSLKEVVNSYNGNIYEKVENKFFREYQFIQSFPQLTNIMNPVVEKNTWKKMNSGWRLSSSVVKSLYDSNRVESIRKIVGNKLTKSYYKDTDFTSSHYDEFTEELMSVETDDIVSYAYNGNQKVKAQLDEKNQIFTVYQRSDEYDGLYVDAILTTKTPYNYEDGFFIKKSFENPEESDVLKLSNAFSGDYVFNGTSINFGDYPAGYEVSFWTYENNKWKINEYEHIGNDLIITRPNNASYIDEIIIKPKNSSVVSYTYRLLFGTTSVLNDRGEGERIEYDVFGRPVFLLDKDKNVIKEFRNNNINQEILRD